jgi:NAD(P)H-dependent flavin oxidoreductase YrpB (nitropropane dioxygenase family)
MIVAFLVGGTALVISVSSVGILGSESGQTADAEQINELVRKMKQKCTDAQSPQPSTVSSSADIELRTYDEIRMENEKLKAINNDGDPLEFDLRGCNYNLNVDGGSSSVTRNSATNWHFEINSESGEPPVITVTAEPR